MSIPAIELQTRVFKFQELLRQNSIDGALLVHRADTLYYSGTAQNVHMYIPREGRPVVLAYRDFSRAQEESPWGVIPLSGLSKIPQLIQGADLPLPKKVGLEYDVLPLSQFERYRKIFPEVQFVDISYIIRLQRAVKSDWELGRLEETALIFPQVFEHVKQILKPGMTEIELEAYMEEKARRSGHEGLVRVRGFDMEFHMGSIAAGARSAVPGYFNGPVTAQGVSLEHPQGASKTPIAEGEPVLLDAVMVAGGYQTDQSRIVSLGNLAPELQKAHNTALEAEEKLRKAMIPGRTAGEVYDEILTWVKENTPYEDNFMGFGQGRVNFVGHGIGLELDELPTISKGAKEVLVPGMVVAIEPKFVFPGLGVVGIEDTVVVEGNEGARYITKAPREFVILHN